VKPRAVPGNEDNMDRLVNFLAAKGGQPE
jgi:hypothetical protein